MASKRGGLYGGIQFSSTGGASILPDGPPTANTPIIVEETATVTIEKLPPATSTATAAPETAADKVSSGMADHVFPHLFALLTWGLLYQDGRLLWHLLPLAAQTPRPNLFNLDFQLVY